jgi:hypothetical protein
MSDLLNDGFIQRNPCPFKYKRDDLETCRAIAYDVLFKAQCVGENNCPIYKGGMG